jgi:hypothetical protein
VIADGQTTALTIDQSSAALVIGTLVLPRTAAAPTSVEMFGFSGAAPASLVEARARARAERVPQAMHGGKDALAPIELHDVASGTYQLCGAGGDTLFGCTGFSIAAGEQRRAVEVVVRELAPPTPP